MKTKHYIGLLMVLTLAISACKKSGSADTNPIPTVKKYVTQQVIVSLAAGIGKVTATTDYTYDSKKRKQSEKTGTISYTYIYYDNDKLFSSTQVFGDGNMLRYVSENTYTGSLLTRTTRIVYKNNEDVDHQIDDYIYDGSNRLTEDHYALGGVRLYTYDSNNDVVKAEDRRLDGSVFTVSTYDANHRKITVIVTTAISGIPNTSTTYAYDSHDNPTKIITITGTTKTTTTTVNYTNTYDADGYLLSAVGDDGTSKTYTYSTL